ncbi:MAG TPA: condensation domain-containing protein, partial [Chloroflexota bacterium]|nr:condensation domain-containing protein [Chloroflexota bacterium]
MADLAARIAALSPQQRALLSRRIKLEGGAPDAGQRAALNRAPIPRLPRPLSGPATFPLSFAQQRLWFMYQLDPQSSLFNVPGSLRLRGPVDVPALERSLLELVRRHETLRTTIAPSPDGAVQVVSPPPDSFSLPLVDLSGLPAAEREGALREHVDFEARRPFDLVAGPLLRATLLRVTDDDHVLLVVVHHIVSDGWSAGVMTREVLALYESFAAGRPAALPELPLQYGDVAAWQQEAQQVEALAGGQAYWESRLRGAPLVLEVPPDHPRPAAQTFRGARQSVLL